jgi:hypothetical protein
MGCERVHQKIGIEAEAKFYSLSKGGRGQMPRVSAQDEVRTGVYEHFKWRRMILLAC